jgi:hypothetical protein
MAGMVAEMDTIVAPCSSMRSMFVTEATAPTPPIRPGPHAMAGIVGPMADVGSAGPVG